MFASLKNKIREETGNDLSKLTAKITSSTVQKIDSFRGKSQSSASSITSIISSEGVKEDSPLDREELKCRLLKLEADFSRRLENKEKEWEEIINSKDKQIINLEKEKEDSHKKISELKSKLKTLEDFQQRLVEHQEDKDQLENFQSQELSKIKHLILQRDEELADKTSALKDASIQLEKLRTEVARLRRQEEQLSDVQDDFEALRHSSSRDLAALAAKLAESEEERRHQNDLIIVLRQRLANETSEDEHLSTERKLLEQRLEEAHLHLADIKTSWSDKITSLETQVGRLSRQAAEEGAERRRAVQEKDILVEKVQQLEAELECTKLELQNKDLTINRLTVDLEEVSNELKHLKVDSDENITFLKTQLENAQTEVAEVKKSLELSENTSEKRKQQCNTLKNNVDQEQENCNNFKKIVSKLEKELQEEKNNSLNVQKTLSRVTQEKNAALLRNAEISQQIELVKQEKRRQESESNELLNKINQLENEYSKYKDTQVIEQQLKKNIADLEDQLADKNKSIRTLQLRLADMKKTLQHELRTPGNPNYHTDLLDNGSSAVIAPTRHTSVVTGFTQNVRRDDDDVNFKYLKHVVLKFLTGGDCEAQHLTKAISTVLKFSPDEERLVNDTMEWRRSWFGSRPKLPSKQKSAS